MNTLPAMRICLQTIERNHSNSMRYTHYAGTELARQAEYAIVTLKALIGLMETAEQVDRTARNQHTEV